MAAEIGFRRNMGLFMAVMIGIGATMGPGIFALPGELAHMIGIDIPKGCLIAAIIRDGQFVVPRGATSIEVDDRVIFIGPASAIKKAFDTFKLKT